MNMGPESNGPCRKQRRFGRNWFKVGLQNRQRKTVKFSKKTGAWGGLFAAGPREGGSLWENGRAGKQIEVKNKFIPHQKSREGEPKRKRLSRAKIQPSIQTIESHEDRKNGV